VGTARLVLTDSGNAAIMMDTAGGAALTFCLGEPPAGQSKTVNMTLYWGSGSLPLTPCSPAVRIHVAHISLSPDGVLVDFSGGLCHAGEVWYGCIDGG
jgi:hypothetical protein